VITGSTRLKAGTATKMVLNMISTGALVRIGKTYENLMVDLRPMSAKLVDRGQRIVMELCDVTRDEAKALIEGAGGSVKTAIVMQKLGATRERAEQALAAAGGVIRQAVSEPAPRKG
jgi:N-acetylmuramic acid 6-phosphate etherase